VAHPTRQSRDTPKSEDTKAEHFVPQEHATTGSVMIAGRKIDYQAITGTLVVHPKGWDDVPQPPPSLSMTVALPGTQGSILNEHHCTLAAISGNNIFKQT